MNEFDEMRVFIRIVETGNISKAADQLNIAKSAVSRRLTELESRLGVALINRTTRTHSLTEQGEVFFMRSKEILADVTELEADLRDKTKGLQGRIRMSVPNLYGTRFLEPLLLEFTKTHPDVFLDIDFADRFVNLIDEGFDLAIRIGYLSDSSLIAKKLVDYGGSLCASPEYLENYGMPTHPNDLTQGHVQILYKGDPERWTFFVNGKSISVKVPAVMSSNNGEFIAQAAIQGRGLCLLPDFVGYYPLKDGRLISVLNEYITNERLPAYAVYPGTRHLTKRVSALVDFLSDRKKSLLS